MIDAYSRRIVGWRVATSMSTQLVLDALERSIWTRARDGVTDLTGLIDHHDRSAQYTSIAYTERLSEAGIDASIGANGDSYDNALAETINGLYKTELIKPRGPWRTADHVEIATLEWVDWFNHRRLYETAETSHQPNSKPPTTVKQEPGNPPSSQTNKPPDTPSGFTGWQGPSVEKVEAACPPPVLAAAFFDAYPMSGPRFFGLDLVRVVDRIGGPTAWLMPGKRYTGEQTVGESV